MISPQFRDNIQTVKQAAHMRVWIQISSREMGEFSKRVKAPKKEQNWSGAGWLGPDQILPINKSQSRAPKCRGGNTNVHTCTRTRTNTPSGPPGGKTSWVLLLSMKRCHLFYAPRFSFFLISLTETPRCCEAINVSKLLWLNTETEVH